MKIEFDPEYMIGKHAYPFRVVDFTPFQVTRLSLEDYIEKRHLFSTQEARQTSHTAPARALCGSQL